MEKPGEERDRPENALSPDAGFCFVLFFSLSEMPAVMAGKDLCKPEAADKYCRVSVGVNVGHSRRPPGAAAQRLSENR